MKSEIAVMLTGAASPIIDAALAASSPGALLLIAGLSGLWLASKRSERWVQQAEPPKSKPSTPTAPSPESHPASQPTPLGNQENSPASR